MATILCTTAVFVTVCSVAIASAQSSQSVATQPPMDPLSEQQWCSLPKSSINDFLLRESAARATLKPRARRLRDREPLSIALLQSVSVAMEGHAHATDALIKGQLSISQASGIPLIVPVTYEVMRDGREKIVTQFNRGNSMSISAEGRSHMRMGTKEMVLSKATMDDHQVLVLPQWSLLLNYADESYGVKQFDEVNGLTAVEVLPPERGNSLEESMIPATPTCIIFDPSSLKIARIERVVRPENQLTSEHRQSIVYSNYQLIDGISVPMTQTRYHDGILRDTFTIDSVSFNNNFASREFSWPPL